MASFNKVVLVGNLTRDPEVRNLPSGMAVCDMALAVSETYKDKNGERAESVCYVDVVAWARQAETCGEYLSKGSPVLVEGSLQLDKWTSKEGENRSKLRVRAQRVQFLGGPSKGGNVRDGGDADDRRNASNTAPSSQAETQRNDVPPPDDNGPADSVADEDNLPF